MARKSRKADIIQQSVVNGQSFVDTSYPSASPSPVSSTSMPASTQESIMPPTYKTAIYVRLSIMDSGKKDSESILNQQEMLVDYVSKHSELSLERIFIDNGETGVDFIRTAWTDLMRECRDGKIDCICVKDLSRVGRNYIETGEYLDTIFPTLGVRLIAINDNYDNKLLTENARVIANIKNLINDMYAKDVSRKSASALRMKQKKGEFIGSYASYGYIKDPFNKNKIIIDPETAPILRQIFRWKAEGLGNAQICRMLNAADIPSPSKYRLQKGILKDRKYENTLWQVPTLITILKNPVYLGHMVQGRHVGALYEGKGRSRVKPEDWVIVENTHEPIIAQDLFDEVQEIMKERSAKFKENLGKHSHFEKPEMILAGLIFCADCGKSLTRYKSVHGSTKGDGADKTDIAKPSISKHCDWIFVCRQSEILKACPKKYINEADVNRAVYEAIRNELQKCADITYTIHKLNAKSGHKSRIAKFDAEIEDAQMQLRRILQLRQAVFEDYATKVITEHEYDYAISSYDADTEKQQLRLELVKSEKEKFTQGTTKANKWLIAFSKFMDNEELTAEMAQALIERVIISNRNMVEVVFRFRDEYATINNYCELGIDSASDYTNSLFVGQYSKDQDADQHLTNHNQTSQKPTNLHTVATRNIEHAEVI